MTDNMPVSKLRRRILNRRGVQPAPRTKKLQPPPEQPDTFPKTRTMKMLEYKYNVRMEVLLYSGSLDEVVRFLNNEVDRSTISKWRKRMEDYNA